VALKSNEGLISSVFNRAALDDAYSGVLRAMRATQRAHIRNPEAHKERIRFREAQREESITGIIDRHQTEGTLRFTRLVTKIPKRPGGKPERPISLFSFEERVILRSLLNVVWPFLEAKVVPTVSYCTFRKGGLHPARGIADAVTVISEERRTRQPFIFETDIKAFFDRIDRGKLLTMASSLLGDETVNDLLHAVLYAETQLDHQFFQDSSELVSDCGVPQGAALSPLLACTYLSPFDEFMEQSGFRMLRYVDDLVVLGTEPECKRAEDVCRRVLKDEYGLDVHPDCSKTKHVHPGEALTFLGHEVRPDGTLKPSAKRRKAVAEHVFKTVCGHKGDFGYVPGLPRANQKDLADRLSSYLLGYMIGMKHCDWTDDDYKEVSGYIVSALRSRGLQENRLSKDLRRMSRKWPKAFLEGLP
jgi:RNA-directed DNA polymerase